MKVELDLPQIDGYLYTGEWRIPREGEWVMDLDREEISQTAHNDCQIKYPILKPITNNSDWYRESFRIPPIPKKGYFNGERTKEGESLYETQCQIIDYLEYLSKNNEKGKK